MSTDPSAISGILEAQRAFFASGNTRPLDRRLESLRALSGELKRRTDDVLAALAADLGKPPLEAWFAELHFLRTEIAHTVKHLRRWDRPRRVRNPFYFLPARSEIRREPFGCALVAAPWNYPLQLALSPLLCAVAAGNCVVLKPSELAPATSSLLAELVRATFDPAHVTVVEGGAETGSALLEQRFDFLFYTGGETVGRLYAEAAARHLVPVALELGGKCPCVVDADVDLDRAAERIVATKFFNAGQTCVAPDFVLVPAALHDAFIEKASAALRAFYGTDRSNDLARIVNQRHYERLRGLLTPDAICIGEDDPGDRYLAPRLLPHADWDGAAMQEEIFGPVLPVLAYDHLDDALVRLRKIPAPLALYAFSKDRGTLERIAAAVPSGSVCFNDAMKQAANAALPLGGVGHSGMGRYRGEAGFRTFSYERPVTRRWLTRDPFLVTPPYGNRLDKLRRLLDR